MELSERHRTGIEPAVDNFLDSLHFAAALAALARGRVDIRTVKFNIALDSAHFFEFLFGTHNVNFAAVLANPDRKRSPPVSLAGKSPVDNVLEEVAHSARPDRFGHPVNRFVRGDELLFYRGGLDEPTRSRVI